MSKSTFGLLLLQNSPSAVAIDETSIYWTNSGNGNASQGAIMKMPIGGGAPIALVSGTAAWAIALDATNVYWSETTGQSATSGAIRRVPILGGAPVTLDSVMAPRGIAVGDANVYFADQGTEGPDHTFINGAVSNVPIGGGSVTSLASGGGPVDVAIDSTNAYWVGLTSGSVQKVPLAGGTSTTVAPAPNVPVHVAVFGANVYWTDSAGNVMAARIGGGATKTLASGQIGASAIVANATGLYRTTSASISGDTSVSGAVMRLSVGP